MTFPAELTLPESVYSSPPGERRNVPRRGSPTERVCPPTERDPSSAVHPPAHTATDSQIDRGHLRGLRITSLVKISRNIWKIRNFKMSNKNEIFLRPW